MLRRGENETGLEDLRGLPAAIRAAGEKGLQITRFKGLGEMNAEELRDTTLDPANRTLLQIRMDDVGGADDLFRVLMGDQVEPRREFIQKHAGCAEFGCERPGSYNGVRSIPHYREVIMGTVDAIFEDGVFRPIKPVVLPDQCEVEFELRVVQPHPSGKRMQEAIYEILDGGTRRV